MVVSPTPAPEITQAQTLAGRIIRQSQSAGRDKVPYPDSFMAQRPNTLAESYRHGQGVAHILAGWQAGPDLQAAGLLHSLVWKGALTPEQVALACGERTGFLTRAYRDILQQTPPGRPRGRSKVIRRIKLYVAAYHDPDLAFLGVASMWDHFIMARQSEVHLKRGFTEEARAILIPLLDMLGMWELKEEVEEWVMQQGHALQDYEYLRKRLAQTNDARRQAFEFVQNQLQPALPRAKLSRKMRTPVHIYNPQLPEKIHPESLQRVTIDVLVDTEAECYEALRWIHHFWKPVEGSLRDYVGASKLNGYRCLQTAVILPAETGHVRAHFHIRTRDMDRINRWGLVALKLQGQQAQLPQAWWSRREQVYAHIHAAPIGSLPEILCVFSPQGEVFEFHRGCTVVDYAYQVHSEVAHQTKRFRVNGDVVGPTTILRHLDLVELEQDPLFPGPSQVWLQAAHTSRARSHIERFLNRRKKGTLYGQTVFDRHLEALKKYYRIDIPAHRVRQALNRAARRLNLERPEDLLAEIAAGRYASDPILHPLFSEEITRQVELPRQIRLFPHQLNLAQCCKPRPGNTIVGRPRLRGQEIVGLKIHNAACQHIEHRQDTIPLNWRLHPRLNALVRLEMTALHEIHLLDEALQMLYTGLPHVVIHKLDFVARNGMAHIGFTIEAKNQDLIDDIIHRLKHLPGRTVNEVRPMQLLLSEREELARPITPAAFNPYRRLPVRDRDMFFGRSQELDQIYTWLRTGAGAVFVRGQKRVGKTSLLLHLKEHYLDRQSVAPVFIDFQILDHLSGPAFCYQIASAVYNELQAESRISDVGPPLLELFEVTPSTELITYLQRLQSHFGSVKLVLLIDEFSRTIDAYQQNRLNRDFFAQWRGVLQTTMPDISYVMVVQQQTYDTLLEQMQPSMPEPAWPLFEMGETISLTPLSEKDARQLIERPTHNYLKYSPEALRYVWRLTGGSPFLIHAFCYNLVRHMARTGRRRVKWQDVHTVQDSFLGPDQNLFAHLLDMIRDVGRPICRQLTQFLDETDQPVPLTELSAALPNISPEHLLTAVQELAHQHILVEPEPGRWQFASLLFGRWLAKNTILEQFSTTNRKEREQ